MYFNQQLPVLLFIIINSDTTTGDFFCSFNDLLLMKIFITKYTFLVTWYFGVSSALLPLIVGAGVGC